MEIKDNITNSPPGEASVSGHQEAASQEPGCSCTALLLLPISTNKGSTAPYQWMDWMGWNPFWSPSPTRAPCGTYEYNGQVTLFLAS